MELQPVPVSKPAADSYDFRAMPVGIAGGRNRIFTHVNPFLCEMLGYQAEELIGQSVRLIFAADEEFQRVGRDVYADLKAHGAGVIETILRRKNGELLNVLMSSTQIHSDDEFT